MDVVVDPDSKRLQLLEPFKPWDGQDLQVRGTHTAVQPLALRMRVMFLPLCDLCQQSTPSTWTLKLAGCEIVIQCLTWLLQCSNPGSPQN